jgi:hypothetical protein
MELIARERGGKKRKASAPGAVRIASSLNRAWRLNLPLFAGIWIAACLLELPGGEKSRQIGRMPRAMFFFTESAMFPGETRFKGEPAGEERKASGEHLQSCDRQMFVEGWRGEGAPPARAQQPGCEHGRGRAATGPY